MPISMSPVSPLPALPDYAAELVRLYGPVVGSKDISRILGYASPDAFRKARSRKTIPIRVFRLPGRRGYFASTSEIAHWLWNAVENSSAHGPVLHEHAK